VTTIHHIARRREWEDATAAGEYRWSTRGLTLDEVGFVHCARASQVAGVAERFYRDEREALVVLTIDVDRLGGEVVDEPALGPDAEGGERFPHVYGPIPVHAVVAVQPLSREPTGAFVLPAGLA
jgi:glutathione S-transferase